MNPTGDLALLAQSFAMETNFNENNNIVCGLCKKLFARKGAIGEIESSKGLQFTRKHETIASATSHGCPLCRELLLLCLPTGHRDHDILGTRLGHFDLLSGLRQTWKGFHQNYKGSLSSPTFEFVFRANLLLQNHFVVTAFRPRLRSKTFRVVTSHGKFLGRANS